MWERTVNPITGPWQEVPDSQVPKGVIQRWNRCVRGSKCPEWVVAFRYVYRFRFCV